MRFLLIDRVREFEAGKRLVALKNVSLESSYLEHHFPGEPVFPGVLIVEAMAQASGYLISYSALETGSASVFALMTAANVRFLKVVRPGDQLRLEVDIVQLEGRTAKTRVAAQVDGGVVARAELRFALLPRAADDGNPVQHQWDLLRPILERRGGAP